LKSFFGRLPRSRPPGERFAPLPAAPHPSPSPPSGRPPAGARCAAVPAALGPVPPVSCQMSGWCTQGRVVARIQAGFRPMPAILSVASLPGPRRRPRTPCLVVMTPTFGMVRPEPTRPGHASWS
jgi:hypothetical protein